MQLIPIQDVYNQTFSVILGGQSCQITLHKMKTGMYCSLYVNDVIVIAGVLCMNLNKIVRDKHLGFIGDLIFFDTEGVSDPSTPGLGTRYSFVYLEASDL